MDTTNFEKLETSMAWIWKILYACVFVHKCNIPSTNRDGE